MQGRERDGRQGPLPEREREQERCRSLRAGPGEAAGAGARVTGRKPVPDTELLGKASRGRDVVGSVLTGLLNQ